jgi:hypothetical protein
MAAQAGCKTLRKRTHTLIALAFATQALEAKLPGTRAPPSSHTSAKNCRPRYPRLLQCKEVPKCTTRGGTRSDRLTSRQPCTPHILSEAHFRIGSPHRIGSPQLAALAREAASDTSASRAPLSGKPLAAKGQGWPKQVRHPAASSRRCCTHASEPLPLLQAAARTATATGAGAATSCCGLRHIYSAAAAAATTAAGTAAAAGTATATAAAAATASACR